jgi:hypothetical protein
LAETIKFRSADLFKGIIWNTLADGSSQRLFLEVRDVVEKKVSFSALNLQNNQWLWKNISLEEPWWISLSAVAGDILLLTVYTDTDNPDKKSLIAFNVDKKETIWWKNGFSFSAVNTRFVKGFDLKFAGKEFILDLFTGQPVQDVDFDLVLSQNFPVIRPFQYEQDSDYFGTVRDFLQVKVGIAPVVTLDYLEHDSLIIVSAFVNEGDLANYLYVFDLTGQILLKEQLGQDLKGVGIDTFFIFSGHLIFIKNKHELVSYKII